MEATCLNCQKDFEYSPHQFSGKYCSNTCRGLHKSKLHKEAWYSGTLEKKIDRPTIRKYLTKDRGYNCENEGCTVTDWLGKSITLEVDHIDGNSADDKPSNVRLICPNCHSQSPHRGAANKGRGRKSLGLPLY
jgi:hypothetical protein